LSRLTQPQYEALTELIADSKRQLELRAESHNWPSWGLTPRQLCDLELLLNGGFSPLQGFLCKSDYESVCAAMRLRAGPLWPVPVTFDVNEEMSKKLRPGSSLALRDSEGVMLAALHVEEIWQPDRLAEAKAIFGTTSKQHSGVAYLLDRVNRWYVGGSLEGIRLPSHYDFCHLRLTPAQMRAEFVRLGWERIVAFQTRNPMHRAHLELTLRAAAQVKAGILIHPSVGMAEPGDVNHYTRVRCYQALLPHYPKGKAKLALLPLAMRMGGPREALWHAIIHKNYGVTHFIVGRDHAGPGSDANGTPFYGPYDSQVLLQKHQEEIGVKMVPFKTMVYVKDRDRYEPEDEVPKGAEIMTVSSTELRRHLNQGEEIPDWFTFPEVAAELRRTHKSRLEQGFTLFFTGLSGAGKSTIANALLVKFLEMGGRPVTLLDGDIVRKHLSSELGFSKEHRDLNIRRIGFVASEITKNGGIAICAPIAPYDSVRKEVRAIVEPMGGFVLIHVATPLDVCEQRDRKGLYAKARAGLVQHFTGISDPYEIPTDAEIVIDTTKITTEEAAEKVFAHLERERFVLRGQHLAAGDALSAGNNSRKS
jgi:sulfate adenylyltransferase